jgi:UDP-N-acetylmuramyl pentapeptide phosphotransferase/UDP-N-acetylglucosamine-1-phosphate transferase
MQNTGAMQNSSVSLMTAIVTAIVVFLFTTAWITAKAARNTVRTAKAAVKPARKTFWSTIGGVLKMTIFAAILLIALVAWQVRDVKQVDQEKSVPAPSASHR